MPETPLLSFGQIAAQLETAAASMRLVPHQLIGDLLAHASESAWSASEFERLIRFAAEQFGEWCADYLYSPIRSPNRLAYEESRAWGTTWRKWADMLAQMVPGVREGNEEILKRQLVGKLLERCEQRPRRYRYVTITLSSLGLFLCRVGLLRIGSYLDGMALFPPGCVGRRESYSALAFLNLAWGAASSYMPPRPRTSGPKS